MRFADRKDEYETIAPIYDMLLGPLLKPVRNAVCRIAQMEGFRNILDLCCGTGEQCIMLARQGFRVSGVDLSPAMLEVAKKKSPGSIAYYLENAAHLHFDDHTFDCVTISFALHEKDEETRAGIIREARRVLGRSGKILIVDYLAPEGLASKLGHRFINRIEWLAGKDHHRHFRKYMRRGALPALIRASGIEVLTTSYYFMGTTGLLLGRWQD